LSDRLEQCNILQYIVVVYTSIYRTHNQLGTPRRAKSFLRGAQIFYTMSKTFFQGAKIFARGAKSTLATGLPLRCANAQYHQTTCAVKSHSRALISNSILYSIA